MIKMVRVSLDISRLPHDVLTYADKQFYDFITSFCGQDASDLLSIQVIRSVDSFVTIQDIYSIFELESDDFKDIQTRCGFKRKNGTHTVRPGIKSTLDHLIRLLKEKQNKVGKIKTIQSASTQSTVSLSPSSSSSSVTNTASNINTADTSFVSKKNELEHRAHIEQSIQEWCIKNEKLINISDFNLIFGVDYHLQFSPSLYNAEIKCSCGVSNTLFLSCSGYFKVKLFSEYLLFYKILRSTR